MRTIEQDYWVCLNNFLLTKKFGLAEHQSGYPFRITFLKSEYQLSDFYNQSFEKYLPNFELDIQKLGAKEKKCGCAIKKFTLENIQVKEDSIENPATHLIDQLI